MDIKKAYIRVKKEGENQFELVYPITIADYVMLNGNKPISSQIDEMTKAILGKVDSSKVGSANGLATLDSYGRIPLSQLPAENKEIRMVDNISQLLSITDPFQGLVVYVKDATGDADVKSGGAFYIYDGRQFIKTSESTDMEIVVDWADIKNKPTTVAGYGITDVLGASMLVDTGGKENAGKIVVLNEFGELDVNITGRAYFVSRLEHKRKITLTGDVSGECVFDGGENVYIKTMLESQGIRPGTYTKLMVDNRGRIIGVGNIEASDLPPITPDMIQGFEGLDEKTMVRDKDQQMEASIFLDHDPINNMEPATKRYVNAVCTAQNINIKEPVRFATDKNVVLSGLQYIDNYPLVEGDRVLVNGQNIKNQNGIYVASNGTWERSSDLNTGTSFTKGTYVLVNEGKYANCGFMLLNGDNISLGTSNIEFAQFIGPNDLMFTDGLTKNGNTVTLEETIEPGEYVSVVVDKYGRVIKGKKTITLNDLGGLNWGDIKDRPSSNPDAIDTATDLMHYHENDDILDYLGTNDDGNLTFKGKLIATDSNSKNGLPKGGKKGQLLSKTSELDYASEWTDIDITDEELQKFLKELQTGTATGDPSELFKYKMPGGGIAGQALIKRSSQDYDTKWYNVLTPDDNITDDELKTFIAELMVEFGTGIEIDPSKEIISCKMPKGGTTGQFLVKKSDSDHDTKWANVDDYINSHIPPGGKPGQVLVKYSANDYDLTWADGGSSSGGSSGGGTIITGDCKVPAGGKQGQHLAKKSGSNYDLEWVDEEDVPSVMDDNEFLNKLNQLLDNGESGPVEPPEFVDYCKVPAGGKKGQHLIKKSDTDYDLQWTDVPTGGNSGDNPPTIIEECKVPKGGSAGQILAKKSGNDFDTQWIDAPKGGGSETPTLSGKLTCIGTERDPDLVTGGIWFKVV